MGEPSEAVYARPVLVAQLSDTHLLADPSARLWGHNTTRNLVAVLEALPPRVDVMVVTGDIAEDGAPDAYRRGRSRRTRSGTFSPVTMMTRCQWWCSVPGLEIPGIEH